MMKIIFLLILSLFITTNSFAGIVAKFNHEAHEKGAFKTLEFNCSNCHNFSFGPDKLRAKADADLSKTTFKADFKNTCHQCHNTEDSRFKIAPKECILCHAPAAFSKEIKPISHQNAEWKTTHSLNARTEGSQCLNCHIQADCLKCHLRRNDIQMVNHSRNFRFTHSVEARAQPHRCDACHTQNFCIKCHIGK